MEVKIMAKKRLYVDMDGVLCVFKMVNRLEMLLEEGYFRNLIPQEAVIDAVKQLIKDYSDEVDVFVLTSYLSDSSYAVKEKMEWLDEYLPEINDAHRLFVSCDDSKNDVLKWKNFDRRSQEFEYLYDARQIISPLDLGGNDFLLDDYTKNLIDWDPPGRGIKLLNGINHTFGTWKGSSTYKNRQADDIANDIKKVLNGDVVQYPIVEYIRQKEEVEAAALLHEHRVNYVSEKMFDLVSYYGIGIRERDRFLGQPSVTTIREALYSLDMTINDMTYYLEATGYDKDTGWYVRSAEDERKDGGAGAKKNMAYKNYLEAREIVRFALSGDAQKRREIISGPVMDALTGFVEDDRWEAVMDSKELICSELAMLPKNRLSRLREKLHAYGMPDKKMCMHGSRAGRMEKAEKPADYVKAKREVSDQVVPGRNDKNADDIER
jgi:hypothetical protein